MKPAGDTGAWFSFSIIRSRPASRYADGVKVSKAGADATTDPHGNVDTAIRQEPQRSRNGFSGGRRRSGERVAPLSSIERLLIERKPTGFLCHGLDVPLTLPGPLAPATGTPPTGAEKGDGVGSGGGVIVSVR